MSVLFLVLPITLLISGAAVAAFVWATRSGQLDDLETPAWRVMHDNDEPSTVPPPAPAQARDQR